jgi:hypothetical protein
MREDSFSGGAKNRDNDGAGLVNENWQQGVRLYLPADSERAKPKGKHRKVQFRVNIPRKILVCLTVLQLGLEGATLLK